MDLTKLILLSAVLSAVSVMVSSDGQSEVVEILDDFPLDDIGEGTIDQGGGEPLDGDSDQENSNELEDIDLSELEQAEGSRQELLRKVMTAAMAKPGARQRLAQVMPILRTMSATQRLALAGLVTSQLMAPPGAPPPPLVNSTNSNLTDDLMIPISMDIASMFRGLGRDATAARSNLFRGDLYKRHPPYRRRPSQNLNRRNTEVPNEDMKPPPPPRVKLPKLRPGNKLQVNRLTPPSPHSNEMEAGVDCEYFTNTVCLQVADYPIEAILKSIQSTPNKNAFEALRLDAKQDYGEFFAQDVIKLERRQGEVDSESNGYMCSSKVEIARPKRARATSGQWKYVVNTGDYTQTLRLEMCLKPQQSCSYLSENVKSECTQVYNYHRLLTWDKMSGLTMDIFKVPTCCSCHVHSVSHPFFSGQRPETLAVSESVRQPSQPVEPVRHATSPPRLAYAEAPESNFVAADEPPAVHRLPPPKQILNRRPLGGLHNIPKRESLPPSRGPHRGPPLVLADNPGEHVRYTHPQYENLLRRTIARNNSELNEIRPKYHPVQPTLNQRHPELPVDSLLADNSFSYVTSVPDYQPPPRTYHGGSLSTTPKRVVYQTSGPTTPRRAIYQTTQTTMSSRRVNAQYSTTPQTPSSKRVNYSYHPIIDFFKTSVSADTNQEQLSNGDWTPITDGPRLMPK